MRRQKQVPEPGGLRQWLQFLDDRVYGPGAKALGFLVMSALVRINVFGHERADAHGKFGARALWLMSMGVSSIAEGPASGYCA
jgi:hypothetical protein